MISTIFRNLVGNAMKFTGNGGVIVVSAIERQQYIEITVKDNGMGISAEEQKSLFKKPSAAFIKRNQQ
ncbi:MAG: ATP-binding protein [Bacteroidales bacterium]|nr:ATP-binding protein [Bacteroidales bacterium]